jgi:hypothetical protein
MVALSFTTILIQVQAAIQGDARELLPILIAALLAMAGVARSLGVRPELAGRSRPAPSCTPYEWGPGFGAWYSNAWSWSPRGSSW